MGRSRFHDSGDHPPARFFDFHIICSKISAFHLEIPSEDHFWALRTVLQWNRLTLDLLVELMNPGKFSRKKSGRALLAEHNTNKIHLFT